MDKTKEELLPCPVCGSDAIIWRGEQGNSVDCPKCNLRVSGDSWNDSIDIWNTRAATAEAEKYREALLWAKPYVARLRDTKIIDEALLLTKCKNFIEGK